MAQSAADALREQVQQRYGIDIDALGTGADGAAAPNAAARAKLKVRIKGQRQPGRTSTSASFWQTLNARTKARRDDVKANKARAGQISDRTWMVIFEIDLSGLSGHPDVSPWTSAPTASQE
jgi:colicin import membrane protein